MLSPNDLVLTPDGLLAVVDAAEPAGVTVQVANHQTRVRYAAGTALPVVAAAADVERARAALTKEG